MEHAAPSDISEHGAPVRIARSEPVVSVIVVSFECRDLVAACLASLERREPGFAAEVILVDNASTDGTAELVRTRFPGVVVLAERANLGFARANNLACAVARGRHLLFLNPDTVVPPGSLERAVEELEARPDVGMLGCRLVKPDGSLDHACKRGFPTPFSALSHFIGLTRLRPSSRRLAQYTAGHLDADEAWFVDAVNGAMMLVRREALEAVGPMDEDFWLYMEDLDWCYRFWQAGWPVYYWPGAEIVHLKGGSSTRHRSWRAERAFHEGMWRFYRKHYAATRSPVVNAMVGAVIRVKLGISAARNLVGRLVAQR